MSPKVSKEELISHYVTNKEPMHIVAKELNISVGSVYNYCKKYGIESRGRNEIRPPRTKEQIEKTRKANTGKKFSEERKRHISEAKFKGGIGFKKIRSDGYVAIHFPEHPRANKDGMIMEHILVMECVLGRRLKEDEIVHHINHNRADNRVKNLQVMTKHEHMSMHMRERHKKRRDDLSTRHS